MFTYGRQASLGKFLINKKDTTIAALKNGQNYYRSTQSLNINDEQLEFHRTAYLGASYSLFESYLLDIFEEILKCFPDRSKNTDIKFHDALKGTGLLISEMADKQAHQLGYKSFVDIVSSVANYFHCDFNVPSLEIVQEFKATRDIYLHNSGRWNVIYQRKAGPKARKEPLNNQPLPLNNQYIEDGVSALIDFIETFHKQGPKQMERYNRTKAFAEMWKKSALEPLISFDDAWEVEPNDMIRPKDILYTHGWSGSEKYLVDFFLIIFGGKNHKSVESDVHEALRRWPPETTSGQIVLSWLEYPFTF